MYTWTELDPMRIEAHRCCRTTVNRLAMIENVHNATLTANCYGFLENKKQVRFIYTS